jgi:hypothetical protein
MNSALVGNKAYLKFLRKIRKLNKRLSYLNASNHLP